MRTSLSAKEWARLKSYANSLDADTRARLLHRCENWEGSVAIELGAVVDGKASKDSSGKWVFHKPSKSHALDNSLISQVAGWLRSK